MQDDDGLTELAGLPGLGLRSAAWLVAIGIGGVAELERRLDDEDGALAVYLELRGSRPGVSLNALWVLEGLRLGCGWREVPSARKSELRGRAGAATTSTARQSSGGRAS